MILRNTTHIDTALLGRLISESVEGWRHDDLNVLIRYSRKAVFSGTCYYRPPRIFVNIGRQNEYPLSVATHVARPSSNRRFWWRELYRVSVADASQLALFIFMHEFYHYLVKRAQRNARQKEARCDRFALRVLVDRFGSPVTDTQGRAVPREAWDFQDLDGFVDGARSGPPLKRLVGKAVKGRPVASLAARVARQLLLFGS
jgi:hypothetical protein